MVTLFAVLPCDGRGQGPEQPIAGVGVFAGLPVGTGAGTVTQLPDPQPSVQGSPINCSKTEGKKTLPIGVCAAQIVLDDPGGDVILLAATPGPGSTFAGWAVYPETTPTHRCGVEPVCYVLMRDKVAAVAVFDLSIRPPASPPLVPLTVARQGPDAESCAGAATSSTCALTLASSTSVSGTFNVATQQLIVSVQGPTDSGGVSSDVQPGLSCPAACTASFAQNSRVTLTATPAPGFGFTGWSGAGCSGTSTCVVLIGGQATGVTASFTALAVSANLRSAKVVKTGHNYSTRQVQALVRANEAVNVLVRVRRGNVTIAQRTYKQFGPDTALAAFNLRRSVTPGRARVQVTFTNVAGTTNVQTRNIIIPR